jgi:hypothetical protein
MSSGLPVRLLKESDLGEGANVAGGKTWVCEYDAETDSQSFQWKRDRKRVNAKGQNHGPILWSTQPAFNA